ncbi:uncharacterized protein LOC144737667 [Lampetra planeri]
MGRSAVAAAVVGTVLTVVALLSASLGGPCKGLYHQQEHQQQQEIARGAEDRAGDALATHKDLLQVILRRLRRGESGGEGEVKDQWAGSGSPSSSSAGLHTSGGGRGSDDGAKITRTQERPRDGAKIGGQCHRRVAETAPVVRSDVDHPSSTSVVEEEVEEVVEEEQEGVHEGQDSGTTSPSAADQGCGARPLHLPKSFVTDIFRFLASTSRPSNTCGRPGSCGAADRPLALPRPPCAKQDSWSDGAMEASLRTREAFAFAVPSAIIAAAPSPDDEEEVVVEQEAASPTAAPRCGGESSANCSRANARRRRDGPDDEEEEAVAEGYQAKELEEEEEEKVMVAKLRHAVEQWATEGSEGRTGAAVESDGSSVSRDDGGRGGETVAGGRGSRGGNGGRERRGRGSRGAGGARRSHDPLWEVVRSLRERRGAPLGAEWPSSLEGLMDRTLVLLLKQLIDTPPMKDPASGAAHFGRLLRHYLSRDDAAPLAPAARRDDPRARTRRARHPRWQAALRGEEEDKEEEDAAAAAVTPGGQTHGKITKFLVLKAMQAVCEQWSRKKPRSVEAVSIGGPCRCKNHCPSSKNDTKSDGNGKAKGQSSGAFSLCAGCKLEDVNMCLCMLYKQHVVEPKLANIHDCSGQCLSTSGCFDLYVNHSYVLLKQERRQPLCVPVHYTGLKMLVIDNGNSTSGGNDRTNLSAHIIFYKQIIANECGCR